MTAVVRLTAAEVLARAEELAGLLTDTVDGGASVGFLAPLDRASAVAWWKSRAAAVSAGRVGLIAASSIIDELGGRDGPARPR